MRKLEAYSLENTEYNKLFDQITFELDSLGVDREVVYVHGSTINALRRLNSDIDLLVISNNCKGHKRIGSVATNGNIFDISIFHPAFLLQTIIAEQRRGMRTLAGMIVNGVVVERKIEYTQLVRQAEIVYYGAPGAFNWKLYSDKLFSLFKKISASSGNSISYVMIAEAYSLVAVCYLWMNGQWINNGKFLMDQLREYDDCYYFRLTEAYKMDFNCLNCIQLNHMAFEIFSHYGGFGNYSYESSYFE